MLLVVSASWNGPLAGLRVWLALRHGDDARRKEAVFEEPGGRVTLGLEEPLAPGPWKLTAATSDGAPLAEVTFEQLAVVTAR